MKLQAELPIGKHQALRRKTPKIGPLIITLTVLCTIIPIYYPTFLNSQKKLSETKTSSFDHVENKDSVVAIAGLEKQESDSLPCSGDDVASSQRCIETSSLAGGGNSNEFDSSGGGSKSSEKYVIIEALPLPSNKLDLTTVKTSDYNIEGKNKGKKRGGRGGQQHYQPRKAITPPRATEPEKTTPSKRRLPSPNPEILDSLISQVSSENEFNNKCDLFSGEWVPNPEGPYYTNTTCSHIQEHQNCMKFGKPDEGYMKWRWKPDGCELPTFDPHQFLELVRGKSIAFVGDSVARNHMQSLICLLSRVVYPVDVSNTTDENYKRWVYPEYNFNVSILWAPYLVKTERTDPEDVTRPFKLYLDEPDEYWPSQVEPFDYVIISAGHWFFRPTMFYVNRQQVGCLYCPEATVPHLTTYFSYRRAFRTALRAINDLPNFKGATFLRTFAPSHFEGGPWDKGGDCVRTSPSSRNETILDGYNLEMYKIQLEELRIAQKLGRRKEMRFRLFDGTRTMLLRPDGHPSRFGHWPQANVTLANDCVHWCLPGPLDSLNDFLQELLTREIEHSTTLLFN